MPSTAAPDLPNVAAVLAPLLQRVPRAQQPLLLAIAERRAAMRYRDWAGAVTAHTTQAHLRACADREEEIAQRIEGLYPDAAATQRALLAAHPDLEEINRSLFTGRPLAQQFTIQAQGERLGAATWRAFAQHEEDPSRRAVFEVCATLEEESAVVLESLLSHTA
jgi:hypothetical protein